MIKPDADDVFADLLADFDDHLVSGGADPSVDFTLRELPADQVVRLAKAKQCLLLLESTWPRFRSHQEELPEKIDRFRILRELGRGGFGVVYLAHDDKLDRTIALKVQRPEAIISARLRQRFLHEAKAAARLRHPHIAGVYEVGKAGLQIWIATEYCNGHSLADWMYRRGPAAPRAAAAFMASLADALVFSHQEGVFHRDLKPSNILLHRADASEDDGPVELSDYSPKLIDFGLAKVLGSEHCGTKDGVLLGTPAYMAPEQANGQVTQIGPATDVYAIGAVLYQLLVGRPPFQGDQIADTLHQVVASEPPDPLRIRPELPPDLVAICLKCLQKSPFKRYATAADLAADLRNYLAGRPTVARALTPIQRLGHWARRRPAQAALVAAMAFGLLTVLSAYFREIELRRALQQERDATSRALLGQQRATYQARSNAQRATREAEAANKTAEFMTNIFQSSDLIGFADLGFRRADERLKRLTLDEVLRRGSEHVETDLQNDPLVQARLMNALGNINRSLGLYSEAESLLRKALEIRTRAEAEVIEGGRALELDVAESEFNLGWLLHDVGRYDEAEPLYRRALATRKRDLGQDSLEAAKIEFNLAWLMADRGETRQSELLFREVIRIRRHLLPAKDRDVLAAEIGLTAALYSQGRESEALNEAASTLPSDQLVKLLAGYQLASQQRRLKQFGPATKSYDRLLEIAQRELPPQHPLRAAILIDMAGLLKEKGDYPAAESAVREGLSIVRSVMDRHPRLIEGMTAFAWQLEKRGDFAEAEALNRDALDISRQRRPGQFHEKVDILLSLARIQSVQGSVDEALVLLDEAAQVQPNDRPYQTRVLDQLAALNLASGNYQDAERLYRELLANVADLDPRDVKLDLRESLLESGEYATAEALRKEVHDSVEAEFNQPGAPLSLPQLTIYSAKLAKFGEFAKAAVNLTKAFAFERKQYPANHPALGKWLEDIATLWLQSLDAETDPARRAETLAVAIASLDEAQAIYELRLGTDHPWLARNSVLRARLRGAGGDWRGAATEVDGALKALTKTFPAAHPWVLEARRQRALILRELKRFAEAEAELRGVLALRKEKWPALHNDVFEVQLDLAITLLRQGDATSAAAELQDMLDLRAERQITGGRRTARIEALLGACLTAEKDYDGAERHLVSSLAALRSMYGDRDGRSRKAIEAMVSLYEAWNKPEKAGEFRRMLVAGPTP